MDANLPTDASLGTAQESIAARTMTRGLSSNAANLMYF